MPPLGYRRATPSAASAESGVHRAVPDGRAARGTLRALALLVDRMATLGAAREEVTLDPTAQGIIRDALRQFTARIRDSAMMCRIMDGQFVLAGEPVDRGLTRDDPLLGTLLLRCLTLGVGSITVRQGAAPGELSTLAALLSQPRSAEQPGVGASVPGSERTSYTPTTLSAVADHGTARELLRSWSVLVTPPEMPPGMRMATPADGMAALQERANDDRAVDNTAAPTAASAFARFTAAQDDLAASTAATVLIEVIDTAEFRGEARVLEGLAFATIAHVHAVSIGPGRLAAERVLRRLQHRSSLELIAKRLAYVPDRTPLLELLARAGETAIDILVKQLMNAEEAAARRAYFDSIVNLDIGATMLFDLVRDSRWYVVRNAVALLGEMGVEHADTAMLPLMQHADERIRIAAARSLVRLGTARALQGLHASIEDPNAEVRRIAAVSYGLTPSAAGGVRPPAARLAVALEKEADEDVALEMLASLGKLGSADAIQRLLRVAMPQQPSADVQEKPRDAWLRIAAMQALVKARGNAVMPYVETLMNDQDPEVAQAALRLRG